MKRPPQWLRRNFGLVLLALLLPAIPATAAHHFMQIEQVIGGVGGDRSAQAIQLRMRASGQNFVSNTRLVVRDATGANPIVLENTSSDVANGQSCRRILFATPAFAAYTNIPLSADFTMDPIPVSYLAAGSLTHESDTGAMIYWRLSWGGASYGGTGATDLSNDPDGNANPPFAGALPSAGQQALQITAACNAQSTSSSLQYATTPGAATFINNANVSFTVVGGAPPEVPLLSNGVGIALLLGLCSVAILAVLRARRRALQEG